MRVNYLFKKLLVTSLILFISLTQTIYVKADDGFDDDNNQVTNATVKTPSSNDTEVPNTNNEVNNEETSVTYNSEDYYYVDGVNLYIYIYNYKQLSQIGTSKPLYTGDKDGNIGDGELIDGVFCNSDSNYILKNDIELDVNNIWTVPDSFTGTINNGSAQDYPLYDKDSDTVYIYNPYQLKVLAQDNSENEPVMSMDYDAAQFGMGQMIYPNGEEQTYLTYSKSHRYVISKYFNSDRPETVAGQFDKKRNDTVSDYTVQWAEGQATDGRDFPGQVIKEIDGKTYILIGNEQQLRKIGTDVEVQGAVYQANKHNVIGGGGWQVDKDTNGNLIMLYGGDADLTKAQNGFADFELKDKIDDRVRKADGSLSANSGITYIVGRCGVDQKTGKIDPTLDIENQTNQKYSKNANYIIFRDIDLSSSNWNPITFQGTMIGAKSTNNEKLWNDIFINTKNKPIISNVKIEQNVRVNVGEQMGIGFFSTISSEVSDNDIGLSKGLVKVSNIKSNNLQSCG